MMSALARGARKKKNATITKVKILTAFFSIETLSHLHIHSDVQAVCRQPRCQTAFTVTGNEIRKLVPPGGPQRASLCTFAPHPVPKAPFFAESGMANDSRYQPCSPYSNRSSASQR